MILVLFLASGRTSLGNAAAPSCMAATCYPKQPVLRADGMPMEQLSFGLIKQLPHSFCGFWTSWERSVGSYKSSVVRGVAAWC